MTAPSIRRMYPVTRTAVLLALAFIWIAMTPASAATINAASPSRADVVAAINAASPGDQVLVPAGSATWASTLTITKNISVLGAGIGNTIITNGTGGSLLAYAPTTIVGMFRLSGFTFDAKNGQVLALDNGSLLTVSQVRIDHNRFTNSTATAGGIEIFGVWGVIDSNVFDNLRSPIRAWGSDITGAFEWSHYPALVWGGPDNIYFEDNTITTNSSPYMISDMDQGGRYVFRYNSFAVAGGGAPSPWLDMHGGRGQLRGSMGAEIYGNTYASGGRLVSHRGGRATVHHNQSTGAATYNIYDNDGCPPTVPERINNTYVFLNRDGATGALAGWESSGGDNCGGVVVENGTFWIDAAPFIGTFGVGAGTLAARPATCTTGVGYWATDQSVTSLAGMVGANPTAPIAGTLYKCIAPNTWTAYYAPYIYPHPLRKAGLAGAKPNPPPTLTVR